MTWIPVTLAAAVFQILRTSRQHQLQSFLSPTAAGAVRYLYALPFAAIAAATTFVVAPESLSVPWRFWLIAAGGATAQILGTIALLQSFRLRDFAIGTVYAKTEVIQVAVISAALLGEPLKAWGWLGAALVAVGVALLAADGRLVESLRNARDPAATMGILAGAGFGLAATGIRAASNSLGDASVWHRSMMTLVVMLTIQTAVNALWLGWRDRDGLIAIATNWRQCVPVGLLSMCGTTGWAVAMTLTNAAKVRTLGQIEIVFAFAIGVAAHGESHTRAEYVASAIVVAGIVAVIVLG
jgi:drug/metabolite transporter (DMT)-like permease